MKKLDVTDLYLWIDKNTDRCEKNKILDTMLLFFHLIEDTCDLECKLGRTHFKWNRFKSQRNKWDYEN